MYVSHVGFPGETDLEADLSAGGLLESALRNSALKGLREAGLDRKRN